MPGYATARSALTLLFLRLDDGVMSLGLSEKATTERERDSTLRPSAWFLDNVDNGTLAKIADLVCNRGHVTARRGGRVGGLPRPPGTPERVKRRGHCTVPGCAAGRWR